MMLRCELSFLVGELRLPDGGYEGPVLSHRAILESGHSQADGLQGGTGNPECREQVAGPAPDDGVSAGAGISIRRAATVAAASASATAEMTIAAVMVVA